MRLLYAEDEKSLARAVSTILIKNNYSVDVVHDGESALDYLETGNYDGAVLDVMMPKKNGYQVLKQIRRGDPSLPVIFLSAKGSPADVSLGLDLGSDDYLPKPFDGEVLLSRIKAVFRRTMPQPSATAVPSQNGAKDEFMVGSHRVDAKRYRIVGPKGREEALSEREVELLRWFVAHPSEVVKREDIFCGLWGYSATVTTRAVDQQILKLRKKLGKDGVRIETVHRLGYRYVQG